MVQQTLPEKPQMSQKRHLPKINKHPDQTQAMGVSKKHLRSGELLVNSLNPHIRGANLDISHRACRVFRDGGAPMLTTPTLIRMMRVGNKQDVAQDVPQSVHSNDSDDEVVITGERKRARSSDSDSG